MTLNAIWRSGVRWRCTIIPFGTRAVLFAAEVMDTIICSQCENSFQVRDESRIMEWTCPVCGGDDYIFPEEEDEGYYDEHGESDTDPRLREY